MNLKIVLSGACVLLILAEALADNSGDVLEHNLPAKGRSAKDTIVGKLLSAKGEKQEPESSAKYDKRVLKIGVTKNDDSELETEIPSEELSRNYLAVGSDFGHMAALVPANLAALELAGIGPRHIIGYVPLSSGNGAALVFPAGGVRVVKPPEESIDFSKVDIEQTEVGRQSDPLPPPPPRRRNRFRSRPRMGMGMGYRSYPPYYPSFGGGFDDYPDYPDYPPYPNYWRRQSPVRPAPRGRRRNPNQRRNFSRGRRAGAKRPSRRFRKASKTV